MPEPAKITRTGLTFTQKTAVAAFMKPRIKPIDGTPYWEWLDGKTDAEIAALAAEHIGASVTASNIRGLRQVVFGALRPYQVVEAKPATAEIEALKATVASHEKMLIEAFRQITALKLSPVFKVRVDA